MNSRWDVDGAVSIRTAQLKRHEPRGGVALNGRARPAREMPVRWAAPSRTRVGPRGSVGATVGATAGAARGGHAGDQTRAGQAEQFASMER